MRRWLAQVLVRANIATLVAWPSALLLAPADAGAAVLSYDSARYR